MSVDGVAILNPINSVHILYDLFSFFFQTKPVCMSLNFKSRSNRMHSQRFGIDRIPFRSKKK